MSAATSEERSRIATAQTCGKDTTRSGPTGHKQTGSPEGTLPPLCPETPSPSPASFVARRLFSRGPLVLHSLPSDSRTSDRPLSVVELPHLIARVVPVIAIGETKWAGGPRLMASALGTEIPIRTSQSLTEKGELIKATACKDKKTTAARGGKATKPNKFPLTGSEVVQIFAQERHQEGSELYFLKEVDGDSYRPYDLQVVQSSEAGSEHYIFAPDSVLHVTETGYGGLVGLAEWHRESVLWKALQAIPFFRDFRLRKSFTWWHRNVRKILFQRRREALEETLLIAVPQFRSALHLFARLIEDLKETHFLPQEASQTFTLLEFKNFLKTKNQECLHVLETLAQRRTVILNVVKEKSYEAHQELRLHMEYANKPNKCYEPIHLHLAHRRELEKELARSESVLQRLGNFGSLVGRMIEQSLATVVRRDVLSFLSNVLKRKKSQQCSLFYTELCFGAGGQLTVDPQTHLFQEAASEALLTVGDSIIQMCDSCGFFLEISNSGTSQDLTSDLSCIELPNITGADKNSDGMSCRRKLCRWRLSAHSLVLPKRTQPTVQGNMVRGCYCPLTKSRLQWQIGIGDLSRQVEREQVELVKEAELEIQQLCEHYKWLVDIHLFIGQWSRASLESMRGEPASRYEEHIKKMRNWAEGIDTVPSSISTSNQLFIIHCTHTKETLGRQLRSIEEELLEHLAEQMKLHSQSLVSDLERASAELETEPQDLRDLSQYALMTRESVKLLADMQKRLEYVHSLQNTVRMNYRQMTEQELTLEEKMLGLWDRFTPLLKEADDTVGHRLPPAANALDAMASFLVRDLRNTISEAARGPFLDPTQDAKEMVSKLNYTCAHVRNLNAKLEQLNRNSQNLQDSTMDLTFLTLDIQEVTARKELWELVDAYTTWMEEWKQLLLCEVVVSQAQEKIAKWREQALSLSSIIPTHDAVLRETLGILESSSHRIPVVAELQSPALRHKHWREIFEGLGLLHVPEKKVTVAELMSQQLEVHQKLITKICRDAQAECNVEQTFQKLRQRWTARLFRLDKFTHPVWQHCEQHLGLTEAEKPTVATVSNLPTASQHSCNDARFTIIGLEKQFAEIENDLMTLSTLLRSQYSFEFRQQIGVWMQSLQDLEKLLDLLERFQQMWAFLMKMFNETFFSVQRVDLLEKFKPVDETFKEFMCTVSADPHSLNFVNSKKTNEKFHGIRLCQTLIGGLSTMEDITNQMADVLDSLREQFPRLWFLSDREVIQLLAFHPVPFTLQLFVRKCFKGVHWLEVDSEIPCNTRDAKTDGATSGSHRQMKVLGVFASLQEHITFRPPLEPNLNALVWLSTFEKRLNSTMMQLVKQCGAVVKNHLQQSTRDLARGKKVGDILLDIAISRENIQPVLDLLTKYPLQCLLVAEEAAWCSVVRQAFHESSPVKPSDIKAYNSARLKDLCRSIWDRGTGAKSESQVSKYMVVCLSALVQLTMNQAQRISQLREVQCELESSFDWLSLMKYHINPQDQSLKGKDDPACYVDVWGHRFQYGYEYVGPEDWVMVQTPSTDRATLGILLALTSYRCGFVGGPCMSGKKNTVVQVGRALGRQVVIVQCYPTMRPCVIQQMLFGALQTGAWLLLDSVDLLTQGVLSSLGQHLLDIHQSFSGLTGNRNPKVNDKQKDRTADGVIGCTNDGHMEFAGKNISASLDYGCVLISSKRYTPEVPESLRFATRPVALAHPDYRIVAEVMLTSIGFSEAMSLSQRLVSLISLAKDSRCLPDFITDDQSCYLVVLQKIISASEMHLKQSVRQQDISDEAKRSDAEKTDLMSPQNVSARDVEMDGKGSEKSSTLRRSHLIIMQGLMEETAIVKAILSVLLPVLYDQEKASQFCAIFKDAFPIACQFPLFQQYIEEEEKSQLKDAVTEELQRKLFQPGTETICGALSLYQTMKISQAVLLIGPSGSGKTICHSALAGALNSLAAKTVESVFENVKVIKGDPPHADSQISSSKWNSVESVVLFPNAMSHDEVFGCFCGKGRWQDGAVPKVLRVSERWEHTSSKLCHNKEKGDKTPRVKWLIMDGEPVGHPGWLDHLTTLCNPADPFLFLSSGEKLVPPQSCLKLLMEITDLSDASPSAVTRCSLIHFTGTDLWKAVWRTEMDALYAEHRLPQGTLRMWNRLAEDLFHSTLSLLRQNAVTSAIHSKGQSFQSPTYGLQEIMSCFRILRALLQHFGKEVERDRETPQRDKGDVPLHGVGTPVIDGQSKQVLLARNLFLLAYIWGFGGHLHPCHWPQFDLLVRQVLFSCRYKIVVPGGESVFEHFFNIDSETFPKNTLLTNSITPKYGKYIHLLNIMLEANQPVLLAGEPSSGKTSLCRSLLSFDKPHISLPASPLLSSRDLRTILSNISCQKYRKDTVSAATKQPRLLLFVDDLHEAPSDSFGKMSTALESLRESISKGEILTFDTHHFKLLGSGILSYMATWCVSGLGNYHGNAISSRLSRLFSIFVLPSPSIDKLLSIHSPRLQAWLKGMPLRQSGEDMACCIITATKTLYHAVCDRFQPTEQRPYFLFSHHDLQKVFQGMYLWQPNIQNTGTTQKKDCALPEPTASALNVTHLWMHECMRTFSDRFCSEDESKTLVSLIAKVATTHYGVKLVGEPHPDGPDVPPTVTSLAIHSVPTHRSPDIPRLLTEPEPAGKSDYPLAEMSPLSENGCSEKDNLTTHPLQPQILHHVEGMMARLIYGPQLSEELNSMDQQHNVKFSSCYKEQDLDTLLQKLSALTDRKGDNQGQEVDNCYDITSRYMLHRQRVSQLLHVLRALLIPGGHGVLISLDRGTGRRTTVRLAAHLTGYQLMEVHSGNEDALHEILKEAGNRTRVDGGNVVILVHDDVSQAVREELLVSMAHGTYPALHTEEDLRNLVSRATAVRKSRRYLMDSWMFDKILSQVHRNVHVFLLMSSTKSDTSEGTRVTNRQMAKALSLSCCVEVYQPWSRQSLVEVAAQCLKTSRHQNPVKREGSVAGLSVAMAGVHQSACQYASVLLKSRPFSPQTYVEFISHFGYLCNHLHKQGQGQANRVASVLSRLDVLNDTAWQNKLHLERLREKVAETQQREKLLLGAVDDQRNLLEEAQRKCVLEENKLYDMEERINHARKQVQPVFLSGLNILKCLNPSDLEEVRHYRDPPDGVVTVMDAICLLFHRPPGWESAKQLLGQANFFQELEFYDRSGLLNEQLRQLGQIVDSPRFAPESVREVSKACESLSQWVQAVYECCCARRRLLSEQQQLEGLHKEARGRLHLAGQHQADARRRLEDFQLQLRFVRTDLEELLLELHDAEDTERQSSATAEQLATHVRDWRAAAQEAELHNHNLPGDALILAAIIAYLGPFAPDTRKELLNKWRNLCQTGSIHMNPDDPRTSLFTPSDPTPPRPPLGFPIPVSERLQRPLGRALGMNDQQLRDTVPAAGLVVQLLLWGHRNSLVQRWPLLADVQQHLELSSQSWNATGESVELETECDMVIRADDPELLDKLDQAAESGLRVLVTHVELAIPSPQFLARLAPPAGRCLPGLKQRVQPTHHPEFRLFLSTHLPVRLLGGEIHPSILSQVRVVDLSLSSGEIRELMLTQLLQHKCEELLIRHRRLRNDKQTLQEELVREEDALMDAILQSLTSQLPDLLHSCVAVIQEAMKKLQDEIQQMDEELEHHRALVAAPRRLVKLAAALHRALQDVSCLSPAYYFSLRGFVAVMQDAIVVEGRPLVSQAVGRVPRGVETEVANKMVAQLLVHYRPCLFKSHVAVLKLLVSVAVLQHNRLCSEGERGAFLRGLQDVECPIFKVEPCSLQSTTSLPRWIPPCIHPELLRLERIPAFTGLISSLSTSPTQWQEYLHFPSSTVAGAIPCRSHSHLSLLQRALLWKTMLPDCLEGLADVMAACILCPPHVQTGGSEAPHTGNPESLSRYLVKHEGAVILTLPRPGGDKPSVQPLHLIEKLAEMEGKQQVEVISLEALCAAEVVLSALDKAVNDGHWFVLNSCHLLEQWDHTVVARISRLFSSFKEERCLIHPRFRLWFITQENAVRQIPAAVRLCALPLVCDSPWDLKEELSCSLRQVVSVARRRSPSPDDVDFLLGCAAFHSVLLQRQTWKHSGQGRIYNWSQGDLLALVDAHYRIASVCRDNTKALQYVAVNLVHGGHVLDSADLEVVESVAATCLSRVSPHHMLSNVSRDPGQFDLSGLLQLSEQGLRDSSDVDDRLALGFGVDVAAEVMETNGRSLNVLLRASQSPPGAERSLRNTTTVHGHAGDRLQALRSHLANERDSRVANAQDVPPSSLRDFLRAEWDELIDAVSSPTAASLLELADVSRLERRAELLGAYIRHNNTSDPPGAYRLSAFRNARGFLVAVMSEAARVNREYISDVKLHFQVLSDGTSLPQDAVCLCGLELRGASWDAELGALQDAASPQPRSLPPVCVRAEVRGANAARETDASSAQGSDASRLPVYHCPLYLDEGREAGGRGLADVNIITKVPLRAGLDPVLCSLRRVRLVSLL